MTTLETARNYKDLLASQDPRQQFAFATIFDDSSLAARRRSKWKFKMLQRISPKLRRIMWEGEKVRYLSRGIRFSFWESYFAGWVAQLINRRAIVVTDRRIILIQIDRRSRAKELVEHIQYSAIRKVGRTILGNTRLLLNNGRKTAFAYIPRADRQFVAKLVTYTHDHLEASAAGVEHLCPHCFVAIEGFPRACAACGGDFKSVRTATLRSLLFPGLGDWYIGHRLLAGFEIAFVALLWLTVLIPTEEYPVTAASILGSGLVLFMFVHIPDAFLTRYIARRGVYPERR